MTDPDNSVAEITWAASGNILLTVAINPATKVATITTPGINWNGSEIITFTATDPGGLSDRDSVTFTVTPVNDPPVVADIPNQTVPEGTAFAAIHLNNFVTDPDNSVAEITWAASGNILLTVAINPATKVATITTPGINWNGSEIITFTATDPGGLSDRDSVTFTVTPVNDPPVVADIPNQTVPEGTAFAAIHLNNFVTDPDNSVAEITWAASGNILLTVAINPATKVATITTPGKNWNGSEIITFTATDPGGLSDRDSVTFTVTPVNDPPVVADIPNQTVPEGTAFAAINLNNYVTDPDNSVAEITWAASGNILLTVAINPATKVATITTPGINWNGSEIITFTATDPGGLSDRDSVTFTVTPINDPPILSEIEPSTLNYSEGEGEKSISSTIRIEDIDNVNIPSAIVSFVTGYNKTEDRLIFQNTTGISGIWNSETGSLNLTGTATLANYQQALRSVKYLNYNNINPDNTLRTIKFIVFDGNLYSNFLTRNISVTQVNDPPSASNVMAGGSKLIFSLLSGNYSYHDPEGDAEGNSELGWFRALNASGDNPVKISASRQYRIQFSEGGKWISFAVKPKDVKNAISDTFYHSIYEYVNAAPVALNPKVTGLIGLNQIVTAEFDYSDPEDNPEDTENHKYTWYKADDDQDNSIKTIIGTEKQYSISNADDGKFISFEAVPAALSGSLLGETISSDWFGPVRRLPSAEISGNDSVCTGDTARLTVRLTYGTPPWSFTFRVNGKNSKTISGIKGTTYILKVVESGVYSLSSVKDANRHGIVSGTARVSYRIAPTALLSGGGTICEGTAASLKVELTGRPPWAVKYRKDNLSPVVAGNIASNVFIIPVKNKGTYTLTEVTDKYCKGTASGNASVSVLPAPEVEITGLQRAYSVENKEIPVFGKPKGGSFSGDGLLTRNDSVFFYPRWAGVAGSPHKILYTYVSPSTGCTGKDSVMVDVLKVNADIVFPNNKLLICYNDKPFIIRGTNIGNVIGKLTISGGKGLTDNGDNSASIAPSKLTGGEYHVTYRYYHQAWFEFTKSFTVEYINSIWLIGFDKNTFCNNELQYPLNGNMENGVFHGENVTGNQNTGFYYVPSFALPGRDTIFYTYTTPNGCSRSISEKVTIYEAPIISFLVNDSCINTDSEIPVYFTNHTISEDTIVAWQWSFDDPSSGNHNTSTLKNPEHVYRDAGTRYVSLQAMSFLGCSSLLEKKLTFGDRPKIDFKWDSECFHENEPVLFTDHSTIKVGLPETYQWTVKLNQKDSVLENKDIRFSFDAPGEYLITHVVKSNYGCSGTLSKVIPVRPLIIISENAYYEDFENGTHGWNVVSQSPEQINTWVLDNSIQESATGSNYWHTQIRPGIKQQSSVISPCFDFSMAQKPMIRFAAKRSFDQSRDGAVLQYTSKNINEWNNVGDLNSGINWYNKYSIKGLPGGQSIGWSDTKDKNWTEMKHHLDFLKGLSDVQLRFAYGNDGTSGYEGFAFDSVWIGNRSKLVLLEHFTNTTDTTSISSNTKLQDVFQRLNSDVVKIHYHTSFPGHDPLNRENPLVAEARVFYYGLIEVPYTLMDGGKDGFHRYDYYLKYPDISKIQMQSLSEPLFDIDVTTDFTTTAVNINLIIKALKTLEINEYTLHIAIIEKEITGVQSINGESRFRDVVKALVPSPAGSYLHKEWTLNEKLELKYSWNYSKNVRRTDQLRVIAFIQDEGTREIYQSAIDRFDIVSSDQESPARSSMVDYKVYPNPASDYAVIAFSSPLVEDFIMRIYSADGKMVENKKLEAGTMVYYLETMLYEKGLYFISLTSKNTLFRPVRLVVNN
ncbi:MAG: Ig-like domain-containing protein [Bacteroidales bacterium]